MPIVIGIHVAYERDRRREREEKEELVWRAGSSRVHTLLDIKRVPTRAAGGNRRVSSSSVDSSTFLQQRIREREHTYRVRRESQNKNNKATTMIKN